MKRLVDINQWQPEQNHHGEPKRNRLKNLYTRLQNLWPKNWRVWVVILIVLAVLWKLLAVAGFLPYRIFPAIDKNKWQVVFLSNNQVYFGHLESVSREYWKLTNIYYLRAAQQIQPASGSQQVNLVKLGSEIHGPEDEMYIPNSQISFWENLRDDSAIVRTINNQSR